MDDTEDIRWSDASDAVMIARSQSIELYLKHDGESISMFRKDDNISEEKRNYVRETLKEKKKEIVALFKSQEEYRKDIAETREEWVRLIARSSSIGEDVVRRMTVYHWLWRDAGCITGRKHGCFSPYVMPKCHACRMEGEYDEQEEKAV